MRFCYKFDRYSKNFIPLVLLSYIYTPIYYYRVKIKGRPLINEVEVVKEPVIGQRIKLEEYQNDSEFEHDLKNIK
jgi:hypothetical protein